MMTSGYAMKRVASIDRLPNGYRCAIDGCAWYYAELIIRSEGNEVLRLCTQHAAERLRIRIDL